MQFQAELYLILRNQRTEIIEHAIGAAFLAGFAVVFGKIRRK